MRGIFRKFCFYYLGFSLSVSVAQNAQIDPVLKRDFPQLTKRMAAGQPADFVIVIDKSKSMVPFWDIVKKGVSLFLEAIPDGDYVSLIVFGKDSGYMTIPSYVNPSTRSNLLEEIRKKIERPTDMKTDLGKAFEKTLDELNRPGGNKLKFVFFLTDFNHDPPEGSKYKKRDPNSSAWQELVQRRKREQQENVLQVFALLLPLEKEVGRDIGLGKAIFPELEQINVNQYTLLSWFDRKKAEIARDKLRAFVHRDSQKAPFEIEKVYIQRRIFSSIGKLYVSVKLVKDRIVETVALPSLKPKISIKGERVTEVEFEPEAVPPKISLSPSMKSLKIPLATVRYLRKPILLSTKVRDASVEIEGVQSLMPSLEIKRLNLPTDVSFSVASTLPLKISYGYIPPSIPIVIVCITGGAIIGIVYRRRPEYIVGEINIIGVGTYRFQDSERRKTIIIGDVKSTDGISIPNADWRLIIKATHPGGEIKKPRGIYVKMERGQGMLIYREQRQSITTLDWVRIHRGCTIEVGGRRISFN